MCYTVRMSAYRIEHDPEANALYLWVASPTDVAKTEYVGHGVTLDVDAAGTLIGIEVILPNRPKPCCG
jgi:uncharacterized protein YuzE